MSNGALLFLNNRLAVIIIAKFVDTSALGFFSIAQKLSSAAISEFVQPAARPLFPGLAKIKDDGERLSRLYTRALSVFLLLGVPLAAGTALIAEPLVRIILGEAWIAAVPLVEVLALFAILRIFLGGTKEVFMALGKPHYTTVLAAVRLAVLLPLLFWGVMSAGAYGAVWAITAATALRVTLNFFVLARLVDLRLRKLTLSFWRVCFATCVMVALLLFVQASWAGAEAFLPALFRLLALIILGASSYIGCYLLLRLLPGEPPEVDLLLEARLKEFLPRILGFRGNRPSL